MTILSLIKRIPSYASDVKINVNACFDAVPAGISQVQLYGIALTAGYALKHEEILNDIRSEAKIYLEGSDAMACKVAVIDIAGRSILNTFSSAKTADNFAHKLSFAMADSLKVEEADLHLYYLTAAVLLRCEKSISFCVDKLKSLGVSDESIAFVVKLSATLHAAREALDIETLRSYDFITRESSF